MHIPEPLSGTILIIDQAERLGKDQRMFEEAGLTVLTASTMEEGWQLARQQQPDIVLSEVMLEKPDAGFTLAYRMKKDVAMAKIPLVLLSSIFQSTGAVLDLNSPSARLWIKADLYLERPITSDRLVARVGNLLLQSKTVH